MSFSTYTEIRHYREKHIENASRNHTLLNQFHDELFNGVVEISLKHINNRIGPPPSPFSFFLMGSAGRFEQSVWSDQDHGIVYQDQATAMKDYFLALGKEITEGLYQSGYSYCDGGVMASNPLWCHSLTGWQEQIKAWASESTWESIRHLIIFMDGRSFYGEQHLLHQLKTTLFNLIEEEHLLDRIYENTMYHKKGINLLGQLLAETHGENAGSLNIKETALFPYVNTIRLLAIKEKLLETSTLERLERLSIENSEFFKGQFIKLLDYRLHYGNDTTYHSSHFIPINQLTKTQKKELKAIIKNGERLTQIAKPNGKKVNRKGEAKWQDMI